MSSNICLYFRLLKALREGLELLYEISSDVECPHISDLEIAVSYYSCFFESCSKDLKDYDGNSSTTGTN